MPESYRYVLCDVFTDVPLEGNQLAVFTDARAIPEPHLQRLARETNLSETVFCYPAAGDGHVRIRIFTPAAEIRFAGHPTLGAAFVLAGPLQLTTIALETGAGLVPVEIQREGSRIVFGRMSQPVPTWQSFAHEAELLDALDVRRSELPVEVYDNGIRHVYVTLPSADAVAALEPDGARLARLGPLGVNCVAGAGRVWKSRVFVPGLGVPEDPATGSAAGPLGVHLVRHGRVAFDEEVEIRQGAEIGRPSRLYVRVSGDGERVDRVEVGGSAVIVARGEFRL